MKTGAEVENRCLFETTSYLLPAAGSSVRYRSERAPDVRRLRCLSVLCAVGVGVARTCALHKADHMAMLQSSDCGEEGDPVTAINTKGPVSYFGYSLSESAASKGCFL